MKKLCIAIMSVAVLFASCKENAKNETKKETTEVTSKSIEKEVAL